MATEIKITIKLPSAEWFKKIVRFFVGNLKKIFWFVVKDIKNKKWRGLVVMGLSVVAYFIWGISSGLLWLLFLLFLVYGWENRIIGVLALISLASCPVLLSLKRDDLAETMAVYAYFFLVMVVVLQIVEYKRHPELYNESKGDEKK